MAEVHDVVKKFANELAKSQGGASYLLNPDERQLFSKLLSQACADHARVAEENEALKRQLVAWKRELSATDEDATSLLAERDELRRQLEAATDGCKGLLMHAKPADTSKGPSNQEFSIVPTIWLRVIGNAIRDAARSTAKETEK